MAILEISVGVALGLVLHDLIRWFPGFVKRRFAALKSRLRRRRLRKRELRDIAAQSCSIPVMTDSLWSDVLDKFRRP